MRRGASVSGVVQSDVEIPGQIVAEVARSFVCDNSIINLSGIRSSISKTCCLISVVEERSAAAVSYKTPTPDSQCDQQTSLLTASVITDTSAIDTKGPGREIKVPETSTYESIQLDSVMRNPETSPTLMADT